MSEEPLLCPMQCVLEYLARSAPMRGSTTQLLLTVQKPHHAASSDTLARWLKRTLGQAGIDINIFSAHSIRSATSSHATRKGVSISDILAVADWSSAATFHCFYRRSDTSSLVFSRAVLS